MIEKKPFTPNTLWDEEEREKPDTFTIRLNKEEREQFNKDKKFLRQSKDSTAIKQLCEIARIVLHEPKTNAILEVVINNDRRNKRLGIIEYDN